MAYKQSPGRGNNPKTGNGVPAPFKQTMGATGLGAGTAEGKYATKVVKKVGGKIAEGAKKMDKALEGNSDTRSFNRADTVLGRRSTGARAGEKLSNPKSGSPVKQMETINKVVSKAKEIGSKIVGGIKKMDKALEGNPDTRSYERSDTVLGRRSTGARAGEKISNPKSGSPTKQLNKKAVTKMGGKKTPAKMKKC